MPASAVLVIGNVCTASSKPLHLPLYYRLVSWILDREPPNVKIILLSSYESGLNIPSHLAKNPRLTLLFGGGLNEHLVTSLINEHKVESVLYFDHHQQKDIAVGGESIIDSTRLHLASLTHTLEALRKAERIPNFVYRPIAPGREMGETGGGGSALLEARFTSALALLHAFATSYRIPIKVVKGKAAGGMGPRAFEFITGLFPIGEGIAEATKKAQIFEIGPDMEVEVDPDAALGDLEPAARILIYGAGNRFGAAFREACRARGVSAVGGKSRPGIDGDAAVAAEIDSVAPSHVAFLINGEPDAAVDGSGGESDGAWLNGEGPTNLLHNMQRHFYAVWTLANACVKRGIHFTYVGTNSIEMQRKASNIATGDDGIATTASTGLNRYEIVERWASRSLALFKPIRGTILRVRLQCSEDDSMQKSADLATSSSSQLLDLVLSGEGGCFNVAVDGVDGVIRSEDENGSI